MGNTNLTIDWIGNEALRLAHEKASFIGTINREFDSSFQAGYGNTIRIRIPSQYTQVSGRVIDIQDGVQQSTSITVATQHHVAMRYNSQEMSQDLVNFQRLHLEPAMAQLVSYIDGQCLSGCTISTYNSAGTAGTAIAGLGQAGLARAKLNQFLAPKGERRLQIDSVNMSNLVSSQAAYFNPSNAISENYREGLIARTAMADYYENERVATITNATISTQPVLATYTIVEGDTDLTVSTMSGATPTTGQIFTIGTGAAGIYAVHPETKAPYNYLQQFVVTAGSTSSVINFQPAIRITGARKNVAKSTGADITPSTVTTAIVTFLGDQTSTYGYPLMYNRDAFTFATAALPLMDDAIRCVVKTYDGISLRVWEASDIRNDEKLTRIDILWGIAAIRPQWACRLIGTGV